MYKFVESSFTEDAVCVFSKTSSMYIPFSLDNYDYQKFLQYVIENGEESVEGTFPAIVIDHLSKNTEPTYKIIQE